MKDASGYVLERCQACNRLVREVNVQIGRNGLRVGPGCFRKQLRIETDSRMGVSA